MTAISLIPKVVEVLINRFCGLSALTGVQVGIGAPAADNIATETVFVDSGDEWNWDYRVLSGGQATVARDEEAVMPWVVECRSRIDRSDSFARAFEISDAIALHVASDPRLGGVSGLVSATFTGGRWELLQSGQKPNTKITMDLRVVGKLRS